jgi:hypothetical protein
MSLQRRKHFHGIQIAFLVKPTPLAYSAIDSAKHPIQRQMRHFFRLVNWHCLYHSLNFQVVAFLTHGSLFRPSVCHCPKFACASLRSFHFELILLYRYSPFLSTDPFTNSVIPTTLTSRPITPTSWWIKDNPSSILVPTCHISSLRPQYKWLSELSTIPNLEFVSAPSQKV